MRGNEIIKRGIAPEVIEDMEKRAMSIGQIAEKYNLTYSDIQTFLRDHKLSMYNDENLEAIAMSEEFNPLSVVEHFFQSIHHASKELAFTAITAQMLREEMAKGLAEQGIDYLDSNPRVVQQWRNNTAQLLKLTAEAPKMLTAYNDLFNKTLDTQRQVSYVKVVSDILRTADPALYRKLQVARDADPAAKRVLDALSREDVLSYWDSESGRVVRTKITVEDEITEDKM